MCDYSLCGVPNRLAVEGEELVVHRFPIGSVGLAPPADLVPKQRIAQREGFWVRLRRFLEGESEYESTRVHAVCVPPGAHLILKGLPPSFQREYGVDSEEVVVFVQTSADANVYRDAVQFQNGRRLSLQILCEGLRVEVLSLACADPDWDKDAFLRREPALRVTR